MLPVRSRITTTSTGTIAGAPHGPTQAAATFVPVFACVIPTALPKVYCRVALSETMIVLQTSVAIATGSHGAQHTTPVQRHLESLAKNETLQTPGMSATRGFPFESTPTRQMNEVPGVAIPGKFCCVKFSAVVLATATLEAFAGSFCAAARAAASRAFCRRAPSVRKRPTSMTTDARTIKSTMTRANRTRIWPGSPSRRRPGRARLTIPRGPRSFI